MRIKALEICSDDSHKLYRLAHEYRNYCGLKVTLLPRRLIVHPVVAGAVSNRRHRRKIKQVSKYRPTEDY